MTTSVFAYWWFRVKASRRRQSTSSGAGMIPSDSYYATPPMNHSPRLRTSLTVEGLVYLSASSNPGSLNVENDYWMYNNQQDNNDIVMTNLHDPDVDEVFTDDDPCCSAQTTDFVGPKVKIHTELW